MRDRMPNSGQLRRLVLALCASILVVGILMGLPTSAHAAASATLGGDDQILDAARSLSAAGVLEGWDESVGVPQEYVTRGQLAIMLVRALDLDESREDCFSDVSSSMDCFGAVGALYKAGLVAGGVDATFAPEEPISRRHAVLWIMEALGYQMSEKPTGAVSIRLSYFESADRWLAGFKDRSLLDASCARAVANACRLGIVAASSDGRFYPTLPLSWGDAAIMLDRAFVQPRGVSTSYPQSVAAEEGYPNLRVGSEGPLVWYLQYRLDELKYFVGEIDGVYGYHTRDAIIAFHKVERMKRTGTVDGDTWRRLSDAETPAPKLSDAGTRVEVDLTRQVLFLITDDQVWKIVHVSTGRSGTRTGHFQIGSKYKGNVSCVTVDGVMYYPSYVVSRTAIHGYPSVPTYPASHGCVRVPMWTAKQLWYETPTGMTVDIYYNK